MDAATLSLAIIKAVGLLVAGVFGVIGALTNFKDAQGKLTVWGKRNLAALVFGLVASLTAQCIDYIRGHNEATAAAERANKAAHQAEELLGRTTAAAERITMVGHDVELLSRQASEAADKLIDVGSNVQRGLDPLDPIEVHFSFRLPLPQQIENVTDPLDKVIVMDLVKFREQLDALKVHREPDDEAPPAIALCRGEVGPAPEGVPVAAASNCRLFPSEPKQLPNRLLTERYEAWFGFYKKRGDAKHAQIKGEPLMAFWVHGAPRVDGGRDGLDLAPSYVPEAGVINFSFPSEVVGPDNFYWPRSVRSVRDLLGMRMAIEFRTDRGGWLPEFIRRSIRPSLISFYLPGRRELQFTDRNLVRVEGARETYWIFDFPETMERLQRTFL